MCIFGAARGQAIGWNLGQLYVRIPWLLLLFTIWTGWNVLYEMVAHGAFLVGDEYGFVRRPDGVPSRTTIGFFFFFFKQAWIGPLFFAWWSQTGFVLPPPVPKSIMMSTKEMARLATGRPQEFDFARTSLPVDQLDRTRFRSCGVCGDFPLGDRVYHCHAYNRHYPVYDHYCGWLWLVVFNNTIKPFLLFQLGLAADGLFTLVVSIYWATATSDAMTRFLYGVQSAVVAALIALGVGFVAAWHIWWLGARNTVAFEMQPRQWWMVRTSRTKTYEFVGIFRQPGGPMHPWELSKLDNLRQVFGKRIWTWPLWWMQPERVTQYGKTKGFGHGRDPDFELGSLWYEHQVPGRAVRWPAEISLSALDAAASRRRASGRSSAVDYV